MNEVERQALAMLLSGEHPVLHVLRGQLAAAAVAKREMTGVGFFTHFEVPTLAPRLDPPGRMVIGDVYAEIVGLEHDAGFLLFVEEGVIKTLECFIVDYALPEPAKIRRIYHVHPATQGSAELVETPVRDLEWAVKGAR